MSDKFRFVWDVTVLVAGGLAVARSVYDLIRWVAA